jgi:hypothetical protein
MSSGEDYLDDFDDLDYLDDFEGLDDDKGKKAWEAIANETPQLTDISIDDDVDDDGPQMLQAYANMNLGASAVAEGQAMDEDVKPGSKEAFVKRIVGEIANKKLINTSNLKNYIEIILGKLSDEQIVLLNDELTVYTIVFFAQKQKLGNLENFCQTHDLSKDIKLNLIRYIKLLK